MMLRDNVLATLAYYDVLDFPLTAEEVLKYLIRLAPDDEGLINLQDIKTNLDQLILDGVISFDEKYYFLGDRNYLVPLRKEKERISKEKRHKAHRAIRWLQFLPYVEAVFASGSLALNNCDELSDLDVLVVVRHGRIWQTRLMVSGVLSLLGMRRKSFESIAPDKICLNHYITDQSLNIPFENLYNAQTYINLKPILLKNKELIINFFAQNTWLKRFLINPEHDDIMIYHRAEKISWVGKLIELLLNIKLGNWLENKARKYQIKRIEKNPLTKSISGHIVYSDKMLSFHPDSPENSIMEKYQLLLKKLKTTDNLSVGSANGLVS